MQAALRPRLMVTLMLVCAVMAVVLTATPEAGAQEPPPDPTPTPEETKGAGEDEDEARYHVSIRPPTGFQRKSGTVDSITMEWDAVPNASDYWLEIASATADDWSTVTAIITGTEETADDLDCGTAYRFRVQTFPEGDPDVHEYSDPTTPVEASTEPCQGLMPDKPRITYAGLASVDLEWKAVGDDDLTLPNDYVYQVEHSAGNTNTWSDISTETGGTTKTLIVTPCGTMYHFRVKAKENSTSYVTEFGAPSGSIELTLACDPVVTVERRAASVTEGQDANFTFRANPVSKYRDITVTYGVTAEGGYATEGTFTATIAQKTPTVDISIGTKWDNIHKGNGSVTVTITNLNVVRSEPRFYGVGTADSAVTVVRDDDAPPPANLVIADPWPQSLTLTWNAVPDGHGYWVERQTAGSARWVTRAADTAATRFVDTGLAPDTRYYYRVSTRGDGSPYVASFTLTYAEMNERTTVPPDFEADAYTFRVNTPVQIGTGVGHVRATPPNPGEPIRYSLRGTGANPAFQISATTGQITATRTLNVSPGTTYTFTAVATDNHGAEDTASVTVRINYPPVFPAGEVTFVVTQGATSGTVVGTVRATDRDPEDTVTHTLTGPGAGTLFRIAEGTGRITLGRALTAYPPASYALTVTATDPLGASAAKAVTVRVNRPPAFSAARFGFDVVKTATVGTLVGTASATDPDRDALTYAFASSSVVGNLFTINANTGAIAVGRGLASTTGATVTFGVEVRDVHNALDTATVTVSLLPPPPPNLRVTYLSRAIVDLAWDSPDPAAAFTYRIEQNEGDPTDLDFEDQWMPSLFSVTNTSGKVIGLTCGTTSGRTYHFRVVAQGDGVSHAAKEGPPSERESETLHCTNEVTIAAKSTQVTEGDAAEFTISLNRPFAYRTITVTYTVAVEGGYLEHKPTPVSFPPNVTTATLMLDTEPDFEHLGDGSVTVTIDNVNVPRGEPRFFGIGTANEATVTIRDDDAPPPGNLEVTEETAQSLTLTWEGVANGHGYQVERQLLLTLDWIIVAADTSATMFTDTGLQPDTTYNYRVSTRGDGSPYVTSFTRTWTRMSGRTLALNSPPVFEAEAYTFRVNAPVQSGAAVGQVRATDANPMDIISYALRDTGTNPAFQIDATTGQITATRTLNVNPGTEYTFTAVATDNHGAEDTASVTVRINYPPVFPAGDATFVVTLGATSGTAVGTVTATDMDDPGDTLTYTLTGAGAGTLFSIGQETGRITLGRALTAYPPASYALMVTVTDPLGATGTKAVTVRVNRPPDFSAARFGFDVVKTATVGTLVGTASATDPDRDALTFAFSAPTVVGNLFTINANTGAIAVGSGLASTTGATVTFGVEVRDVHNALDTATVTVSLLPPPPPNLRVTYLSRAIVDLAWDSPDPAAAFTYRIEQNEGDPTDTDFEDQWMPSLFSVTNTSGKVIGLTCGTTSGRTYHFRVVAQGDGVSHAAKEGPPSERESETLHCTNEVTIAAKSTQVTEGDAAEFTISLNRPFAYRTITVTYTVAVEGGYLDHKPTPVSFPPNVTTATLTLDTEPDFEHLGDGSVTVTIDNVNVPRGEPRFYGIGTANEATVTIRDDDAPPPGNLEVTEETAQSLTLTWEGVADGHGYQVERQLLLTLDWIIVAADTAETTFTDTGLQPDTTYNYRVSTRGDGSPYVTSFTRTWTRMSGRTLALNSPPVFEADTYTFRVNAPVASGAAVGEVRATDANPTDIISYALRDTGTNPAFQINAMTGQVTATRRLTAAPGTTYTFTAVATDNHGAEDTASITVRINHPPAFSTEDASFVVTLGATTGMFVGRVTSTDADLGDTLTYTLTGSGAGTLFRIGERSGRITLVSSLTAYPPASYALMVTVTDPVGASATKAVTVRVNRPPAFSETSFAFGVVKTAPVGTQVGSASATDPDLDNLTFSLASPSDVGALFTLDSGTGDIAVGSGLAAFTGTSVTFDVEVVDAHGASDSAEVTITVTTLPPPDKPTEVSATTTASDTIRVSWEVGENVSEMLVQRMTLGGQWTSMATIPAVAGTTSYMYDDTGLPLNTKFFYRVYAVGDGILRAGTSLASDSDDAWTDRPGVVTLSTQTPEVGVELTATLADQDAPVLNKSWHWQRVVNGNTENISGARSDVYTPVLADAGKPLQALVTYDDANGSGKRVVSAETSAVTVDFPTPEGIQNVVNINGTSIDASFRIPATSPFSFQIALIRSQDEDFAGGSYVVVDESFSTTGAREFDQTGTTGWYRIAVRACTDTTGMHCGIYVATTQSILKPEPPQNLDVRPMSLRRALLKWDTVDDVSEARYIVQVKEDPSGVWQYPTYGDLTKATKTTAKHEIMLDEVLTNSASKKRGLAHAKSFQFQIKATSPSQATLDSDYSQPVTIIDNPILTGGFADGFLTEDSVASLQWERIDEAQDGYTVRYRQLGNKPLGGSFGHRLPTSHTSEYWPQHEKWPYYPTDNLPEPISVSQSSAGAVTTTLGGVTQDRLARGELYAIQVNYEVLPRSGGHGRPTTPGKRVFSARDAIMWPSDSFPGNAERVATYPFFGHHQNREFSYIICSETFYNVPDGVRQDWVSIIDKAFEAWEDATDDLVMVRRDTSTPCSNNTAPIHHFIQQDDARNEVRMFDLPTSEALFSFPEFKSDVLKFCLTTGAAACVTSFNGYTGLGSNNWFRDGIVEDVDLYLDGAITFEQMRNRITSRLEARFLLGGLTGFTRQGENVIQSVDVSFRQQAFHAPLPPNPPPNLFSLNIPHTTQFNTCRPPASMPTGDPDFPYAPFRIALHEAGHALGVANISSWLWNQEYSLAHATIPDSVMNYDKRSRHLNNPALDNANTTEVDEGWIRREPDCFPHAFDVTALYALYQTVPRVQVEGMTSGVEGSTLVLTAALDRGKEPFSYEWQDPSGVFSFAPSHNASSVAVTLPEIDGGLSVRVIDLIVMDDRGIVSTSRIRLTIYDS